MLDSGGSVIGGLTSLLSGNFLGGAVGIANAVENAFPDVTTKGVNSSLLTISLVPAVIETFYRIVDEDRSDNGRPYMKNGTMQDLGVGYYVVVECVRHIFHFFLMSIGFFLPQVKRCDETSARNTNVTDEC